MFDGLEAGTLYRVRVAARNEISLGPWSEIVAFHACEKPTGAVAFGMRS